MLCPFRNAQRKQSIETTRYGIFEETLQEIGTLFFLYLPLLDIFSRYILLIINIIYNF